MGAQSILQIIIRTTKEGTGEKEAAASAKGLNSALKDLGLGSLGSVTALGAVGAAIGAVAAFTKQAVGDTIAYANEVRNMTLLTGQSAEESSRVLQVMDDLKVGTDVLTMATKTLSKQGLSLNIETLAKLSDEYNKLGSGAEKTRFLVDKFGKSGLAMAEAMGKGGDALRQMAAAQSGALILTQKSLDDTREYEKALDDLNDQWEAVKVGVGTKVVPALTAYLNAVNKAKDGTGGYFAIWKNLADNMKPEPIQAYSYATGDLAYQMGNVSAAALAATPSIEDLKAADEEAATVAKNLSDTYSNRIKMMQSIQGETDGYNAKQDDLIKKQAEVGASIQTLLSQGWSPYSEKVLGLQQEYKDLSGQMDATAAEHKLKINEMILDATLMKLSVDGLTSAEYIMYIKLAEGFGIMDKKSADTALAIDTITTAVADGAVSVDDMVSAINNIPDGKTIDVVLKALTDLSGIGGRDSNTNGRERARGGPVAAKTAYIVGEQGPELFVPSGNGTIIPNGGNGSQVSMAGGAGSGFTMHVTYAPQFSTASQSDLKAALYPIFLDMQRRARADGQA
jgi:hypothetical protein